MIQFTYYLYRKDQKCTILYYGYLKDQISVHLNGAFLPVIKPLVGQDIIVCKRAVFCLIIILQKKASPYMQTGHIKTRNFKDEFDYIKVHKVDTDLSYYEPSSRPSS